MFYLSHEGLDHGGLEGDLSLTVCNVKTNKRNRIKRKDITERKSRVGLFLLWEKRRRGEGLGAEGGDRQ